MKKALEDKWKESVKNGKLKKSILGWLGEILMVVLGILIALKINNWNDRNKKLENLEKSYEQLLQSLAEDSTSLAEVINEHEAASMAASTVLAHFNNRRPWNDSLARDVMSTDDLKIFTPQTATFEAIKISGVELIENQELKRQLFAVYEEHTLEHRKKEATIKHIRNNFTNVWLTRNFKTGANNPHHWKFRDYDGVFDDIEFLGNLGVLIWRQFDIVETATDLSIEIRVLRRMIEKELKYLNGEIKERQAQNKDLTFKVPGYPDANSISIRCTLPDKSKKVFQLKKENDGWVFTLDEAQSGYYLYQYYVDGAVVEHKPMDSYPKQSKGSYSVLYNPY